MDLRQQLQQTLGTTYVLDRELGGGGMSRVFVADAALQPKVAEVRRRLSRVADIEKK